MVKFPISYSDPCRSNRKIKYNFFTGFKNNIYLYLIKESQRLHTEHHALFSLSFPSCKILS